ncbi:polysaccharide deacetylase family protein [Bacteroides sp.]|uniref:polysaccharide deacetylase family protein n=1 Tax=Bacteroides sp. TaxID=29523 RepID=UPI00258505F6|nr:polysaccharide deacetylase family protein [Bacteroides sp.]
MKYKLILALSVLFLSSAFTTKEKKPVTIFMIGDSTMADKSLAKGNLERGWGQVLSCFLTEDVKVENHARDGRSSLSFMNEGHWGAVLSKLEKGDYVFIQFGHNDEKESKELHTEPGSTFDANLQRFVKETRDKGAYPVLFNSIVRRNFPPANTFEHKNRYEQEGNILVDTHGEYIISPRLVAQKMDVPFIDLNKLTHELVSDMGVEKSKDLFMWIPAGKYEFCPEGRTDNTHLNVYGAKMVAGIAIETIAKTVPGLAPYIRHRNPELYVADYKGNKKCAISYTFDDGLLEHYTLVYPILEKLGFKSTFWIWGKCIDNESAALGKPRMTWAQLKEMSDSGHEISSHSWSHPDLKKLSEQEIRYELYKNDSIIHAKVGKKPSTFCYPANSYNEKIVCLALENRVATRLTQYSVGGEESHSTVGSLDKWVNSLLDSGSWGVTMTHGITYGYDCFSNPEIFWKHLENIKKKESEIWVATFAEIGAYVQERKYVQLDINQEDAVCKVTPQLNLNPQLFTEHLTMIVKKKSIISVEQDGKNLPFKLEKDETMFDFNPYGGEITIRFSKGD